MHIIRNEKNKFFESLLIFRVLVHDTKAGLNAGVNRFKKGWPGSAVMAAFLNVYKNDFVQILKSSIETT